MSLLRSSRESRDLPSSRSSPFAMPASSCVLPGGNPNSAFDQGAVPSLPYNGRSPAKQNLYTFTRGEMPNAPAEYNCSGSGQPKVTEGRSTTLLPRALGYGDRRSVGVGIAARTGCIRGAKRARRGEPGAAPGDDRAAGGGDQSRAARRPQTPRRRSAARLPPRRTERHQAKSLGCVLQDNGTMPRRRVRDVDPPHASLSRGGLRRRAGRPVRRGLVSRTCYGTMLYRR